MVQAFAFLLTLAWGHVPAIGAAQDGASNIGSGCALRIHVDGLRNSTGVVGSVVFKSADGWPEDPRKAFRRGPTPILPGDRGATVLWEHLPPGDYGVAAIHDENRNEKLDLSELAAYTMVANLILNLDEMVTKE